MKSQEIACSYTFDHEGTVNICDKFHGNPSSGWGDIWLKTKIVEFSVETKVMN